MGDMAAPTKSYWITGATSGIGLQLAKDLIQQGNFVIVSGRNRSALEELVALAPERVNALEFDASDTSVWGDVGARLKEITDVLDTVIIGAGVCEYVDQPQEDTARYRRVFEVNFFAGVETLRAALPLLRKGENSLVVGIGSLAAQVAFTRSQAYGSSKAAFEYWLDCQRLDLKSSGIRVTVVSPGFVDTPLTRKNDFDMPGLMTVQEASKCILDGLDRGQMYIRFPRRLYWPLRLAQWLPKLWFGVLANKMQKSQSL
jgi:NAD(P)-dependent dehydrogenase (short-subunit alcohol dehydrogenase family)